MSRCDLYLENYDGKYCAGQEAVGSLQCVFTNEKSVRGLIVIFKGVAKVRWSESESKTDSDGKSYTDTTWYSAEQRVVYHEINLLPSAHGSEITIPAGIHKYPFTYTLPIGIPSSYHDDIGEVVYTVKGVVNRPFLKFDYEAKSEIKIVSPLNLNLNRSLLNPVHREDEKNVCCWCCSSGPVSYVWKMPCTGFTPGQSIPINLHIENLSNDNVESVDFRIKKKTTYKSTTPQHKEKDSSQTIAEISFTGVGAHGERDYNEVFRIPANLNVPNLENCDIIQTYYKLEMEISLPCFSFNMEEDVRITLGHIPLEGVNLQQTGNPPDYASIQVESFQPIAPPMEAVGPSAPPAAGGVGWVVPGSKASAGNEAPPNYDEAVGFKT